MGKQSDLVVTVEGITPELCLRVAQEGLRLQLLLDAIIAEDQPLVDLIRRT